MDFESKKIKMDIESKDSQMDFEGKNSQIDFDLSSNMNFILQNVSDVLTILE